VSVYVTSLCRCPQQAPQRNACVHLVFGAALVIFFAQGARMRAHAAFPRRLRLCYTARGHPAGFDRSLGLHHDNCPTLRGVQQRRAGAKACGDAIAPPFRTRAALSTRPHPLENRISLVSILHGQAHWPKGRLCKAGSKTSLSSSSPLRKNPTHTALLCAHLVVPSHAQLLETTIASAVCLLLLRAGASQLRLCVRLPKPKEIFQGLRRVDSG
jgi:hypothetical protein